MILSQYKKGALKGVNDLSNCTWLLCTFLKKPLNTFYFLFPLDLQSLYFTGYHNVNLSLTEQIPAF